MDIYITRNNGQIIISADGIGTRRYPYHGYNSKRDALRKFKEEAGLKYKRGITIYDFTGYIIRG